MGTLPLSSPPPYTAPLRTCRSRQKSPPRVTLPTRLSFWMPWWSEAMTVVDGWGTGAGAGAEVMLRGYAQVTRAPRTLLRSRVHVSDPPYV